MDTLPDIILSPSHPEPANDHGTIFDNSAKRQMFAGRLLELANPFDGTKVKTQRFERKKKGEVTETLLRYDLPEGERYYLNIDRKGNLTEISYAPQGNEPVSYSVVFENGNLKVGVRKKDRKERGTPVFHENDEKEFPEDALKKIDSFVGLLENRLQFSQTRREISTGAAVALTIATAVVIPTAGSLRYILGKDQPKEAIQPSTVMPTSPPALPDDSEVEDPEKPDILSELYDKVIKMREERAKKDPEYERRVNSELNRDRINVCMLGTDLGEDGTTNRADAIVVASLNIKTKETVVLRIPRDLHSPEIAGLPYATGRINEMTMYGKPDDFRRTLEDATGLSQDLCFVYNFDGFRNYIDALGGIDIEVDSVFILNYGDQINRTYGIKLHEGTNHFNGELALTYSRLRENDNDYYRGKRQQQVFEQTTRKLMEIVRDKDSITALRFLTTVFVEHSLGNASFSSEMPLQSLVDLVKKGVDDPKLLNVDEVKMRRYDPGWSDMVQEGVVPDDFYQLYLLGQTVDDPEDPLEYWKTLREKIYADYMESDFQVIEDKTPLEIANERIRQLEEETEGESSFAAQNMQGKSIEVYGDKLFEAWDLINLPVSLLALKKFEDEGGKNYEIYQTINDLLKYHKNELLPQLAQYVTGKSDQFESYKEIVRRLQIELGMINTSYNPLLGITFHTTANDLMKATSFIFSGNLESKHRDFLVNTLIFQPDENSRLGYVRKQPELQNKFQTSFHITGDGRSGANGNSRHDMGGFITADGKVVLFVSLNQHQPESPDAVNNLESKSLRIALDALWNS